jgi:hypothetical protein
VSADGAGRAFHEFDFVCLMKATDRYVEVAVLLN